MKPLLHHLTKFIGTALELYAPLPFEFTADLHTLNAYLRSYTENEEKLLEGFVNRLSEKLQEKMRNLAVPKQQSLSTTQKFQSVLRHYNSCTFKYPELRLNLQNESIEDLNLTYNVLPERESKPMLSQRGGRQDGIKSQRHKFGSKHRNKLRQMNKDFDKENLSINLNVNRERDDNDKSLKCIKSEVDILQNHSDFNRKKSADVSLKEKKDEFGKNRVRYESNDSRTSNTSSLKIKLKPKPTIDLIKAKQGLQLVLDLFASQDEEISAFLNSISTLEQYTC